MRDLIEFLQDIGEDFLNILAEIWDWFPLVTKTRYNELQERFNILQRERDEIEKAKANFTEAVIDSYCPVVVTLSREHKDFSDLKLQAGLKLVEEINNSGYIHYHITDERIVAQVDLFSSVNSIFGTKNGKTN